jgi:hypothetical protein
MCTVASVCHATNERMPDVIESEPHVLDNGIRQMDERQLCTRQSSQSRLGDVHNAGHTMFRNNVVVHGVREQQRPWDNRDSTGLQQ